MSKVDRTRLREWAISGAERRLLEIATEAAAIHQAFPELRQGRRAGPSSRATPVRKGGRRNLSAAARKRISEAQKKRWAAVRRRER
jgi:hypothetical protein